MKFFTYLLLAAIYFGAVAQAADRSTDVSSSQYAVQRIICQQSLVNAGSGDANYQPGVDVNGNAVASADLNPAPQISSSSYTELPLTIDLANRLGLSRPTEANAVVGSLRVYKDGRVLFNGQDITQQATANCGASGNVSTTPPEPQTLQAPVPAQPPRNVNVMQEPEVPMPGSAAPSATTLK